MRTRRKFTDEFKREAVKVAAQPGVTFTIVARELGVERSVLRRWVENAQKGRYDTTPGKPLRTDAQAELESEDGAHFSATLRHARPSAGRRVRLHRALL